MVTASRFTLLMSRRGRPVVPRPSWSHAKLHHRADRTRKRNIALDPAAIALLLEQLSFGCLQLQRHADCLFLPLVVPSLVV
jgi:hypothetical protein